MFMCMFHGHVGSQCGRISEERRGRLRSLEAALIMNRHTRTFLACMLRVRTDLSSSSRTSCPCPQRCTVLIRAQSTGVKTRSYLQYVKRKIIAPKAPPYSHVCQVGDPVLRCRAADVEPEAVQGAEVQRVISTMVTVMRRLKCVGLSAPQLGVPLRIVALEYSENMLHENPLTAIEARGLVAVPLKVFINPRLRVLTGHTVTFQEACESISGFSASVPRYTSVEVSGLNEKAEPVTWQTSGWPARILQHEMDHLDGILYVDRMDSKTFINVNWEEYNE